MFEILKHVVTVIFGTSMGRLTLAISVLICFLLFICHAYRRELTAEDGQRGCFLPSSNQGDERDIENGKN